MPAERIDEHTVDLPTVAFYYPDPVWRDGNAIRNLILFFDGIALLVPEYMRNRPYELDPALTAGLRSAGLLHILEPEKVMNNAAVEALTNTMVAILDRGGLDQLWRGSTPFAELSMSRYGFHVNHEAAERLYDELRKRRLADASKDELSIPTHPLVRSLMLTLLAQILRPVGPTLGLDLCPATDRPQITESLRHLLSINTIPSAGHVVTSDISDVGVDLRDISVDEILAFRREHGAQYRQYARNLRQFVWDLGMAPADERKRLLSDRQGEIADAANGLRKAVIAAWKKRAVFSLSIVGAAWRIHAGDAFGAALALGTAVAGAQLITPTEAGAFSYLYAARRRFE